MYRRKFYIKVLIILIPWLFLPNSVILLGLSCYNSNFHSVTPVSITSENNFDGSSATYYISAEGNDNNSGLSPELAWRTIAKVNSYSFLPGDIILFRRGDEWRESLSINESGTSDAMITFASYGTGAKPIFNEADIVTGWSYAGYNVWYANCPAIDDNNGIPYDYIATVNSAMLNQVGMLAGLDAAGKYFIDTSPVPDRIYMYSTTDPNAKNVEVSARKFGVSVMNRAYIKIQNLDFRNAGHSGAFFHAQTETGQFDGHCIVDSCNFYRNRISGIIFDNGFSNNTVQYCTSTFNGNGFYMSSYLNWGSDRNTFIHCYSAHNIHYKVGVISDGHGYGIWNSDDNIIEHCESNDDQYGINIDPNNRKNDIIIRYNFVHDTQAGTPGINIGGNVPAGTIHYVYGNLVVNPGAGADGYGIWIFGASRLGSVYLFNNTIYLDGELEHGNMGLYATIGTNVTIKNNIIFSNAANSTLIHINGSSGYIIDNNLYYSPNDRTNIFTLSGINYHTLTAWQSASGQDGHSIYGNPLFVNNNYDWSLQSDSPAVNSGVDVGITSDFMGNPLIGLPDIGAFEAQADPDTPIPTFLLSKVENATPSILEMNYNLTLANIVPAASSFVVRVNSVTRTVSSVAISGTKVLLTLASPIVYGDVVTIAYTKPSSSPLQTSEGGQAATISTQPVTNNLNPPLPVYQSSVIENSTPSRLEITYSLSLANIVPAASAFTVMVNSASRAVSSVTISGTKVILTLAGPVASGNVVTVAYSKPSANPLQTAAGGQAASISAQTVTNNVAAATVPVYSGSVIENSTPSRLEITYSLSLANIVPAASAFTVMVNSASRAVSSVTISGTKVILTLASPVAYGNVVTVAFTKPSTNPLQTSAGGQAASISAQTVTNRVAAAPPVPVYSSAAIENATPSQVEITYSLTLANIVPAASAFTVNINSAVRTVSSVSISGTKVSLTLASPVAYGNVVTVAYTKPSTNPLQTSAGGQAASISAQTVTNRVAAPSVPVYSSAAIENATPSQVEITYSLTLANTVPAASAFTVNINSAVRTVSSVSISGTKVSLTLASPVAYGNVVTVAYTKPSTNPLQTSAGGQAASISAQTVTNKVIAINVAPVVVISSPQSSYSGFVNEISASGSFDADKDNLTFEWSAPATVPISSSKGATIKFLGPIVSEPQTIDFTVSVSDGKTTQSKVVPVEILPYNPGLEVAEVMSLEASSYQPPNYPHNIIDGNSNTMWSSFGEDQWLLVELKQLFSIQYVILAFRSDQMGESYFDIFGSDDKVTWEPILIKSASCEFSGDLQVFDFPPSKTGKEFKYVKLVGKGNSKNTWNYISEMKIFGYQYHNPQSIVESYVKIFPNPAHQFINIRINESNFIPKYFQIIDLSGKVLLKSEIQQNTGEFQVALNLRGGIYLVQIEDNEKILFTQKLVIIN